MVVCCLQSPQTLIPGGRRSPGRRVRRAARCLAEQVDPTPALLARQLAKAPLPPAALVCVYRRRNAALLRALIDAMPASAPIALWALDEPVPDLAGRTVGQGPGLRFPLLNQLARHVQADDRWLVVADDDVELSTGGLRTLLRVAQVAQLDACQPAHRWDSFASWRFTRRVPLTALRRTTFVEQGPLFVLSPKGQAHLLPFPEDMGMGWGVEVLWGEAVRREGLRFGIVDGVPARHVSPPAQTYDRTPEVGRVSDVLKAHGHSKFADIQQELRRWRIPAVPDPS